MSIHGACFDTTIGGGCVADEHGNCSEDCSGYEDMYNRKRNKLRDIRKKKNKYYFISKKIKRK